MLDFIRKLFPHKTKSLEEFVQAVRTEGCKAVRVEPLQKAKGGANTAAVGVIADYHYTLRYTATTPQGRKVVYRESLFERFGSDSGFADSKDRSKAAIKLFLLAEKKAKELMAKLPGVSVDIIRANGKPMDEEMYTRLHQDAEACGVSV